jgi:ketosteroid isomerase-like protein
VALRGPEGDTGWAMSQENVEIVRTLFEAFRRQQGRLRQGDIPFGEPYAEDVELDASALQLPDFGTGVYHGREGARRFWMDWLSAWDNVHFEYELVDAGENVVALVDQGMQGSEGIDIVFGEYAQVWGFANGQIVRWRIYLSQSEALEAVGVRE